MRLVVQGFRIKGRKKTPEMLELILIAFLLVGGIASYELHKEKKPSELSVKQVFQENIEEYVIGTFFPVLSGRTEQGMQSVTELFLKTLLSYPMPLYAYMDKTEYVKNTDFVEGKEKEDAYEREAYIIEDVSEDILALLADENGFSNHTGAGFEKNTQKITDINLSVYENTEEFVKAFYTVDGVTKAVPELFDMEVLSGMDMTMKQTNDKPQILIYHTHSQEAFRDSAPGDRDATIVGAGELLMKILTEEYGYNVIHHTGEYDVPSRDYAYSKSLPALEQILSENPSVEVIIDLHRDGVAETTRLLTDLNGVPTAKIMFFNGLSYTKKNGPIGYLENKNLQENLAFSFQMQRAANEYYPGITRKNYLNAYRYNMHLRGKSLLVELGAQTNTVEEIKNAIGPLAHILDIVLAGENT